MVPMDSKYLDVSKGCHHACNLKVSKFYLEDCYQIVRSRVPEKEKQYLLRFSSISVLITAINRIDYIILKW